jgi:hypothetical protein
MHFLDQNRTYVLLIEEDQEKAHEKPKERFDNYFGHAGPVFLSQFDGE